MTDADEVLENMKAVRILAWTKEERDQIDQRIRAHLEKKQQAERPAQEAE